MTTANNDTELNRPSHSPSNDALINVAVVCVWFVSAQSSRRFLHAAITITINTGTHGRATWVRCRTQVRTSSPIQGGPQEDTRRVRRYDGSSPILARVPNDLTPSVRKLPRYAQNQRDHTGHGPTRREHAAKICSNPISFGRGIKKKSDGFNFKPRQNVQRFSFQRQTVFFVYSNLKFDFFFFVPYFKNIVFYSLASCSSTLQNTWFTCI